MEGLLGEVNDCAIIMELVRVYHLRQGTSVSAKLVPTRDTHFDVLPVDFACRTPYTRWLRAKLVMWLTSTFSISLGRLMTFMP